jgi:hypothetical protein
MTEYLSYADVSRETGASEAVLRNRLARRRQTRPGSSPDPTTIPEPDLHIGQSPAWKRSTIQPFIDAFSKGTPNPKYPSKSISRDDKRQQDAELVKVHLPTIVERLSQGAKPSQAVEGLGLHWLSVLAVARHDTDVSSAIQGTKDQ